MEKAISRQRLQKLKETILPLLLPYGVKRVFVFGSFARGEETPESDIDILVLFEEPRRKPLSLLTWVGLEQEMSRALGHSVELVSEPSLSRYIRPYVDKEKVTLYDAEE